MADWVTMDLVLVLQAHIFKKATFNNNLLKVAFLKMVAIKNSFAKF